MGFVYADVTLRGPGGERTLRMLVDIGTVFTWVPGRIARELGARVRGTIRMETADGRIVERTLGELEVEVLGRLATRLIVFGEEGEEALLGVDTLEGLLIEVDPARRRLVPLEAARA